MKIGVYPFASGGSVADNLCHIERAIAEAAERGMSETGLRQKIWCD